MQDPALYPMTLQSAERIRLAPLFPFFLFMRNEGFDEKVVQLSLLSMNFHFSSAPLFNLIFRLFSALNHTHKSQFSTLAEKFIDFDNTFPQHITLKKLRLPHTSPLLVDQSFRLRFADRFLGHSLPNNTIHLSPSPSPSTEYTTSKLKIEDGAFSIVPPCICFSFFSSFHQQKRKPLLSLHISFHVHSGERMKNSSSRENVKPMNRIALNRMKIARRRTSRLPIE